MFAYQCSAVVLAYSHRDFSVAKNGVQSEVGRCGVASQIAPEDDGTRKNASGRFDYMTQVRVHAFPKYFFSAHLVIPGKAA